MNTHDLPKKDIRAAGELAFIVQTGTRHEAEEAIARAAKNPTRAFLRALAAIADLDCANPQDQFRKWHAKHPEACVRIHLAEVRTQALRPLWDAYRYGDRDPQIVAAHHEYAHYLTRAYDQQREAA